MTHGERRSSQPCRAPWRGLDMRLLGAWPTTSSLHNPGISTAVTRNGFVAAPRRRPGPPAGRCSRSGAPADDAYAAVPRDARQADGCAQVQVQAQRLRGRCFVFLWHTDADQWTTAPRWSRNCAPAALGPSSITSCTWPSSMPSATLPSTCARTTL